MNITNSYATFHLGHLYFGIEVSRVQEVIRFQEMTAVPLAPKMVRGLMNLRGQIVTALDLRNRLGLPDGPTDSVQMNVVVRTNGELVSLLVDRIGDVLAINKNNFEPPPETLRGLPRDSILGAVKLQHQLLLLLDTDLVLMRAA